VVWLTDLTLGALASAHRVEKLSVDFEPDDVGGWLLNDMEALSAVVALLIDSIPMQAPDEGKKKPQASSPAMNGTAQLIGENG